MFTTPVAAHYHRLSRDVPGSCRSIRMPSLPYLGRRLLALAVLAVAGTVAQAADSVDALAQDVERLESIRQVKDLQRTYVHLSQAGLWNEMAALFSRDARFIRGTQTITGSGEIAKWLT